MRVPTRTGWYIALHRGISLVRIDHEDDGPIQWWDVRGWRICRSLEAMLNDGVRFVPVWADREQR